MKKRIIFTLFTVCMLYFAVACGKKGVPVDEDLPIETIEGSYLVDVDDPVALISSADYAFVANVVKNNGCEYMDGERPYTNYDVRIIKNIKGGLRTDIDIPIIKWGGLVVDGSCYEIYEGDYLPKEGDVCLFTAYGTEEGELSVGGENSSLRLDVPEDFMSFVESDDALMEEMLGKNEDYNRYVDASANQRPAKEVESIELEHFASKYEEK